MSKIERITVRVEGFIGEIGKSSNPIVLDGRLELDGSVVFRIVSESSTLKSK